MKSPTFERLLLFVCLPAVSWAGHVTFDMVRATGRLNSTAVAVLPSAFGGWSNSYYPVTIRFNGGRTYVAEIQVNRSTTEDDADTRQQAIAGGNYVCISDQPPDPYQDSGLRAEAAEVSAVPEPLASLSPGSGFAYIARIIDGNESVVARLVQRWERATKPFMLFLLGLVWLTPALLYHRVSVPRHGRRRRSHP